MKLDWFQRVRFFPLIAIVLILISTACAPAAAPAAAPKVAAEATSAPAKAPEAAPTSAPAAPATEAAPAAPEAPAAATPTAEAAAPEEATATQSAEVPAASGPEVGAYCLPLDASVQNIKDPLNPPTSAKKAKVTANSIEVIGLPSNGCVFYYTFTGTAPTGLKLEVSEPGAAKPFFKAELKPVDGKPEAVWALVRHAMILSPASEKMTVTFAIRDSLGQVVRQDKANLTSWVQGTLVPRSGDCGCDTVIP